MALGLNYQSLDDETPNPQVRAGSVIDEPLSGNRFIYLQNAAAITAGQCVMPVGNSALLNADVDDTAPVNTRRITATGDFTVANLAGSTAVGVSDGHTLRILFDVNGTGVGQGGVIVARVSDNAVDIYVESGGTTFSNDGLLQTALTNSTDYVVINYTRITPTTEPTDHVIGVAQRGFTDEYWGWYLYSGGGYQLLDTDDAAIATDDLALIPSTTTDGYASGTSATATTAEVESIFARATIDVASDALIYASIMCYRQWAVGVPPGTSMPLINGRTHSQYPAWFKTRNG